MSSQMSLNIPTGGNVSKDADKKAARLRHARQVRDAEDEMTDDDFRARDQEAKDDAYFENQMDHYHR